MKLLRRSLLSAGCFGTALLFCLLPAQAQQPSVGIAPATMDVTVKPGGSYTQVFTLTNNTNAPLRFKCSVADVWYDDKNERVAGRAGTLPRSAGLWVQFQANEVIVGAKSEGTVKAVITVPPGVSGSYYAVPVFEGMPVAKTAPKPVSLLVSSAPAATATIGLRFLGMLALTTVGARDYRVEVMGGKVTPPTSTSELGLQVDVFNRGNTQARVRGAFAILNAAGVLVGRGTIENRRFMPGQRKDTLATWAGELPKGAAYTCVITLSYDRVGQEPATLVYELPFTN